jgi:hypothetical protein
MVFWNALAIIVYRALVLNGPLEVSASPYFFMSGLVLMVFGFLRTVRLKTLHRKQRCPIIASLIATGLLLIAVANFL